MRQGQTMCRRYGVKSKEILERSCQIIFAVANLEENFKDHGLRVPDYFRVSFTC